MSTQCTTLLSGLDLLCKRKVIWFLSTYGLYLVKCTPHPKQCPLSLFCTHFRLPFMKGFAVQLNCKLLWVYDFIITPRLLVWAIYMWEKTYIDNSRKIWYLTAVPGAIGRLMKGRGSVHFFCADCKSQTFPAQARRWLNCEKKWLFGHFLDFTIPHVALLGIPHEFAVLAGFAVRSPEKGLRLILRPTLSLDPPLIVRAKKNWHFPFQNERKAVLQTIYMNSYICVYA